MAWRHHVQLKDLLDAEESDENAQRTGKEMAKRLLASPFADAGWLAAQFEQAQTCFLFNKAMDHMYDSADTQRIWID